MDKRGVELSMNVIIIAAIALIVLVVLVLLVTGAFKDVKSGTGCSSLDDGSCEELDEGENCADYGEGLVSGGQRDCSAGQVCCYTALG